VMFFDWNQNMLASAIGSRLIGMFFGETKNKIASAFGQPLEWHVF
jgi:hypothetical protein